MTSSKIDFDQPARRGPTSRYLLAPHIQLWWAFPIWCFLLAPGRLLALRRYR